MKICVYAQIRRVAAMQTVVNKVLRELMQVKGVNQRELSEATKVPQPTISRILSRKILEPTEPQIKALADFFGITPGQLRGYDPLPTDVLAVKISDDVEVEAPKYDAVLMLSVNGSCGSGSVVDHEEVDKSLMFPRELLKSKGATAEHCRVIIASGDSMSPTILDGDSVLVDLSSTEPQDGNMYAFRRTDQTVSIKRLTQSITGEWTLSSDNPDKRMYKDEPCSSASLHELPIIGRVIWRGGGIV